MKLALAAEDIDEWRKGAISAETMAPFARALVQRREMDQGKRPAHYTEQAHLQTLWANLVVVLRRGIGLPLVLESSG